MAKEKQEKKQSAIAAKEKKLARALSTRGRTFQGIVTRKFPKRVTIEFERTVRIPKYERFIKKKTRIHARLPDEIAHDIHLGDLIKVRECRPLSKIIHFIVIEKIRSYDEESKEKDNG